MLMLVVFDPINRFMWSLTIFLLFFCGLLYLYRALKKEKKKEKALLVGIAAIFIGLSFSRFFFFFSDYFLSGVYIGNTFISNGWDPTGLSDFFGLIATLCFLGGMAAFFFFLELTLKSTKYIPVFVNVVLILLILTLPDYERTFTYISVAFNVLSLLIVLLWFAKESTEELHALSLILITGLIFIIIGTILDSGPIKDLNLISPTIPAIFIIIGAVLSSSNFSVQHKKLLITILISLIGLLFSILLISIYLLLQYQLSDIFTVILWIIIITSITFKFYLALRLAKLIHYGDIVKIEDYPKEKKNLLGAFTKRRAITEEEVSISKEKKVCIVCKKTLARDIYLCPGCDALYCKNCKNLILERENACWVCNNPIDESRPIKIYTSPKLEEQTKVKKIALVTVIDQDLYAQVDEFEWDEGEKEEFIEYMLSLPPPKRKKVIEKMREISTSLDDKDGDENGEVV